MATPSNPALFLAPPFLAADGAAHVSAPFFNNVRPGNFVHPPGPVSDSGKFKQA
jgi:hypothetical protein